MGIPLPLADAITQAEAPVEPGGGDTMLLEAGDFLLLESGDKLLLE